jgi:hypothetical protein
MTELQKTPWRRLAIEATAIIVSILLAFSIDAWWEKRGDRQAETVLLERLRADFLEIRSKLEVVYEDHHETRVACITVLAFADGEVLPATAEMDHMIALIFLTSRTFNPGSGAVASFLNSEKAQLIRNQVLADHLLAWSGLVEELQEEESNLQKGVAERWSLYLASRVNVGPYLQTFGDIMQGIPNQVSSPTSRNHITVDTEFVNHVLDRFKWQQIALRDIVPVQTSVEEILVLLDQELSEKLSK